MKIVSIKGGLGNQLFQYAYGRSIELSGKKIIFDTSFFYGNKARKDTARNFKLNNFNIEIKDNFSDKRHPFLNIYNKIKKKFGFEEENFYQSEKYFKKIENNIRAEFTLKNLMSNESLFWLKKISDTKNSVSLHIRRGDYIKNKIANKVLGTLPLDYYYNAIDIITKKIITPEFFIFSDDIEWVKNNLTLNFPVYFVSDQKIQDYEELILMSKCSNNIIANSTFSWWGAWLNSNSEKIIIAPQRWFKDSSIKNEQIIPEPWITI
jgi:hypothetical protein